MDLETRRLISPQAPPPALPPSTDGSKEKGDGKGLRRRAKGGKGGKRATGPEDEKEEEAHDENGQTQVSHTFSNLFLKHEAAIFISPFIGFLFS